MSALALEGALDCSAVLRAGVYALIKNGTVIYVGKSKSVYQRIYSHRSTAARKAKGKPIPSWLPIQGFVFDQVFVWNCTLEELDGLEAEKVNLYKPKFNQSLKQGMDKIKANVRLRIGTAIIDMRVDPASPRNEIAKRPGGALSGLRRP